MTTIGAVLRAQAAARPHQTYFVCDDERLTYAEADTASRELARKLLALGVTRSSHVGILMPASSAFLTSFFAVTRIGAVAVPLSTFSTASELRGLIRNADVSVLLTARSFRHTDFVATLREAFPDLVFDDLNFLPAAPSLRRVLVDGDRCLIADADKVSDACLDAVEADVVPADRLVIVHTSGSTSAPKGVIHTHGGLLEHLANLNRLRRLEPGMGYFSLSPLFWIGGLGYNVIGVLVAGAALVTSVATDPARTLDLLERERPEMVNGFAAGVLHLAKDPTFARRDLGFIRSGNLWPIMPEALRPTDPDLRHNMLGMTETGSVATIEPDDTDQPEHRRGSFGRPVTDLEVRIVDPDTGDDCADGTMGVLHVRGPMVMQGYYGRERHEVFTADGWFDTGDLFTRDGDGFLYYKGRRGDMIKTAGANVSPREVEAALRDVLPDELTIVLGLPDPERDQIVAAVVIAAPDVTVDEEAIRRQLRHTLSAYKVPRRVFHLAPTEVPMLSSGKIDTHRLIEVLDER